MGIWGTMKKVVNSTVGTPDFMSLDKLFFKGKAVVQSHTAENVLTMLKQELVNLGHDKTNGNKTDTLLAEKTFLYDGTITVRMPVTFYLLESTYNEYVGLSVYDSNGQSVYSNSLLLIDSSYNDQKYYTVELYADVPVRTGQKLSFYAYTSGGKTNRHEMYVMDTVILGRVVDKICE